MHLTQEHHILFSCLQVALWPLAKHEVLPVAEYNANPEKLYRLAASQGVLGLTLDGMPREFPVTDRALRLRWEISVQQMEYRNKRQCEVLKELVLLFRSQDVELMLLKGAGIGMLYARPEHRECGDIDIYLMGDYDKGNRIIESMGIEVNTKSSKHSNFFYKGVPVENHKTFLNVSDSRTDSNLEQGLHRILSEQGTDTIMLDDVPVCIPKPDFSAVFLTRHAIVHFLASGLVLRHFCDLALFFEANKERINTGFIEKMMICENQFLLLNSFLTIGRKYLGQPDGFFSVSKADSELAEKWAERVLEDTFCPRINRKERDELSKMSVLRRKWTGLKYFAASKWKYDTIRKGLFEQVLFYKSVRYLRISNWR